MVPSSRIHRSDPLEFRNTWSPKLATNCDIYGLLRQNFHRLASDSLASPIHASGNCQAPPITTPKTWVAQMATLVPHFHHKPRLSANVVKIIFRKLYSNRSFAVQLCKGPSSKHHMGTYIWLDSTLNTCLPILGGFRVVSCVTHESSSHRCPIH